MSKNNICVEIKKSLRYDIFVMYLGLRKAKIHTQFYWRFIFLTILKYNLSYTLELRKMEKYYRELRFH